MASEKSNKSKFTMPWSQQLQSIESGSGKTPDDYDSVQAKPKYEYHRRIDYIDKAMKSLGLVTQPRKFEDQQGIEYIQKPVKSLGPVLQVHAHEDRQGIEYIQKPMKSLGSVLQVREYKDRQGIKYIQKPTKSLGSVLQVREYGDQQEEYIQTRMRSIQRGIDYMEDEKISVEDIQSRITSTESFEAPEYQNQQEIEYMQAKMPSLKALQTPEYEKLQENDHMQEETISVEYAMEKFIRARIRSTNPEANSETMEALWAKEVTSFLRDTLEVVESENQHLIYNNDSVHIKESPTTLPQVRNFVKQYGFDKIEPGLKNLEDLIYFTLCADYTNVEIDEVMSNPEIANELKAQVLIRKIITAIQRSRSALHIQLLQARIEYLQAKTRSTTYSGLQGTEYEYQQGMEYVQPRMRSRQPVLQAGEYEDHQGIEYIQTQMRSRQHILQEHE